MTDIEIDKIIKTFISQSKPNGKPFILNQEDVLDELLLITEKEEIRRILNEW